MPSRVRTTVIVQLNKELEMIKEMNDKNAKQANEYKEKYYGASSEVKKLTKEASKWFNFQEEMSMQVGEEMVGAKLLDGSHPLRITLASSPRTALR
ncbi:hypothetical protein L7F22_047673 [Adiantum nelumboides]|nr:hypothetical protein [Adiantum nelumboides]